MSTVADYVNRLSDYCVFRQTKTVGAFQELEQALFTAKDSGQICTGMHKLMQRFLLIFLLKAGNLKYDPNRGTTFMVDAERGYWRTVADVRSSFTTSKDLARRQMTAEVKPTDPADEILDDVTLDAVTLRDGKVTLTMTLTSLAGSNYTFIAPISVSVR